MKSTHYPRFLLSLLLTLSAFKGHAQSDNYLKFLSSPLIKATQQAEHSGSQDHNDPPTLTADQTHLIDIISEPENNMVHNFILGVDEEKKIKYFIRRSHESKQKFGLEDLIKEDVVLASAEGKNAVILSCQNCTAEAGGNLTLKYLHNGMNDKFKDFFMDLVLMNGEWSLYTVPKRSNRPAVKIETLRLRSRKVFGRVIGIRKVDVNR